MNLYEQLCTKDPRSPFYGDIYDADDPAPTPRVNCSCDNCFYGRDTLAVYSLELQARIEALEKAAKHTIKKLRSHHLCRSGIGAIVAKLEEVINRR
jgi:hypothetical protein